MNRRRGVAWAVGLVLVALGVAAVRFGTDAAVLPGSGLPCPALLDPPLLTWEPGRILLRDPTTISLFADRKRRVLFAPRQFTLQMATVDVPGRGRRLLVLTAEQFRRGHFLRSHLYLLDPDHPADVVTLSPEPGYNFWDLSVGDVDGDGQPEVALCTWSHTARDPRLAQRFFVYSWARSGDLYPRWRGSRLCRPYVWARLRDVNADGRAELVSVETALSGAQVLVAYAWNQFGFWGAGETDELPADTLTAAETPRLADVDGDGHDELFAVCTDPAGVRRVTAFALHESRWVPVQCSDPLPPDQDIVVVPSIGGSIVVAFVIHGDPTPRPLPLRPVERGHQDAG